MRRSFPLLFLGALALLSCVIVRHDEKDAGKTKGALEIYFADGSFDAKAYVGELWDARLLPYSIEKSTELGSLIERLNADEASASLEFGRRQVAEGAPFNFAVKGEARMLKVDTESRVGIAELDLIPSAGGPADGKADALLQIGPVFKGSSIRDALPFVSFDDFVNQLDYAALSNELNARVRDSVFSGTDPSRMTGKRLVFYGFITYERGKAIVVTPVRLEWK